VVGISLRLDMPLPTGFYLIYFAIDTPYIDST